MFPIRGANSKKSPEGNSGYEHQQRVWLPQKDDFVRFILCLHVDLQNEQAIERVNK